MSPRGPTLTNGPLQTLNLFHVTNPCLHRCQKTLTGRGEARKIVDQRFFLIGGDLKKQQGEEQKDKNREEELQNRKTEDKRCRAEYQRRTGEKHPFPV